MNGVFEWLMVTEKIPKVPLSAADQFSEGKFPWSAQYIIL
jgi:hypothetical protein